MSRGLNMIGAAYVMSGETSAASRYLEQSLEVAEEHDLEYRIAHVHWMLGSGLGEMYELERAENVRCGPTSLSPRSGIMTPTTRRHGSRPCSSIAGFGRRARSSHSRCSAPVRRRSRRSPPTSLSAGFARGAGIPARSQPSTPRSRRRRRAGISSGSATSTRRARRPPGLRATASKRRARRGTSIHLRWKSATSGSPASSPTGSGRPAPSTRCPNGLPSRTVCRSRESRARPRRPGVERGCPFEAARALAESECVVDVGCCARGVREARGRPVGPARA